MHKILFTGFIILFAFFVQAQEIYYLPELPEPVANNAVVGDPETGMIYSFGGIDSTLSQAGIHAKTFIYFPDIERWEQVDDLPGNISRLAAAASILGDTIYVMGGYTVLENLAEESLDFMHRLALNSRSFSPDAPAVPLPVDDHVQVVVGDTAIYQGSGWSNTGNTTLTQYYIPSNAQWSQSTRLRNNFLQSFGASGSLLNDTIYYIGGAADTQGFPEQGFLRKGALTETLEDINWSWETIEDAAVYRAGSFVYNDKVYWIGGGDNTYNFNGLAYDGSGPVHALGQLIAYDPATGSLNVVSTSLPPIMDLRGIAQISENDFCVVGGIGPDLKVQSAVWCINMSELVANEHIAETHKIQFYPNPVQHTLFLQTDQPVDYAIYNTLGFTMQQGRQVHNAINVSTLPPGQYFLKVYMDKHSYNIKTITIIP